MMIKKVLLVIGMALVLSACQWVRKDVTPTPNVTQTPTATQTVTPTPPTITYWPMCTPPLCAIGTSEVYYCSETCPNGCGTTCATYTPSPTP